MQVVNPKAAQVLDAAETYFRETVAPQAQLCDRNSNVLKLALQGMQERGLLALKVPQQWGGSQLSERDFRRFQSMVARYSGALAFLQAQHQSAGSHLVNSTNDALKQEYLPKLSTGKVLVGVGFSHLRRRGEPIIKASPVAGGYRLAGEVPWITGFGFFDNFIIGAALPSGEAVYGMMPFGDTVQETGGTLSFSPPMALIAATATNTVKATVKDWFLAGDRVLAIKPAQAIQIGDRHNVLHQGFFALGCAEAGLDVLTCAYKNKRLTFIEQAFNSLNEELTRCRQAMFEALPPAGKTFEQRLHLRAWAINLAGGCSQAAVVASSGAANSLDHAAGRIYREALLLSVSGQTTAVMEATLEQLLSKGR